MSKPMNVEPGTDLPVLTQDEVTALDDASPNRWCPPPTLMAVRQILANRANNA